MLINGANPECKNSQGRTALDLVREVGRELVVKLLVELLVGFGAEGGSIEEEVAVEEKGGDKTAVKGGLHFLEQVASIFQGRLEGVKGPRLPRSRRRPTQN